MVLEIEKHPFAPKYERMLVGNRGLFCFLGALFRHRSFAFFVLDRLVVGDHLLNFFRGHLLGIDDGVAWSTATELPYDGDREYDRPKESVLHGISLFATIPSC